MRVKTYTELVGEPAAATAASAGSIRIRVWDLPLRLFHWSLVLSVSVAVITGLVGGSWMEIHGIAGLATIGLLAFRLGWGFVGSTHARFRNFAPSAGKIKAYLQGRWHGVGHNPVGAFSVFALLGLLAVQAGTGLFSNDDIAFAGPLAGLVDASLSGRLAGIHQLLSNLLLGLLALHVAAIIFHAWLKKDNLVKPMVTGWKEVPHGSTATKGSLAALIVALLFALAVVYFASGASLHKPLAAPQPSGSAPAW